MGRRTYQETGKEDLPLIKEILDRYSTHLSVMVDHLGDRTIHTDGHITIKKGRFALRNLIAKQLGQMAVAEPAVVGTWVFRKDSKKAKNEAVGVLEVHDLTDQKLSPKEALKAIKKIGKSSKNKKSNSTDTE